MSLKSSVTRGTSVDSNALRPGAFECACKCVWGGVCHANVWGGVDMEMGVCVLDTAMTDTAMTDTAMTDTAMTDTAMTDTAMTDTAMTDTAMTGTVTVCTHSIYSNAMYAHHPHRHTLCVMLCNAAHTLGNNTGSP